jgi:hypothetical protein
MLLCGAGLALRGSWSLAWANAILKQRAHAQG